MGPLRFTPFDLEFVHEGPDHQKTAAGLAQDIVSLTRVGDFIHIEALSLVINFDNNARFAARDEEVNLLPGAVAVAMGDGVHHRFADGDANLMLLVLIETDGAGSTDDDFFRLIHALERGIEQYILQLAEAA